ncbi:hypothetical protein YC2023_045659 [Brassica napus]
MKSVNGELTKTKEEDGGAAELEEEIDSSENRIRQRRQIHQRTRQRRPENSSGSSDLITVGFEINLETLRFGIEGERETGMVHSIKHICKKK